MPEPGSTSGGSRGSRVEAYTQKAFTRLRDWESEWEYRLVLHTDTPDPIEPSFGQTLTAVACSEPE